MYEDCGNYRCEWDDRNRVGIAFVGQRGYEISLISTNPDKYISRWDSDNVRWYTLGQWMDELKKQARDVMF